MCVCAGVKQRSIEKIYAGYKVTQKVSFEGRMCQQC